MSCETRKSIRSTFAGMKRLLTNARQVSEQNADLFDVANTAIEEVRTLVGEWRKNPPLSASGPQHNSGLEVAAFWCADQLEAIVAKYDAAVKVLIK